MGSCDLRTGLCSDTEGADMETFKVAPAPKATILYATDPICSHCWAMEPAWRKLLFHYGAYLEVRHVYGGLLPEWRGFQDAANGIRKPADVAPHWAEVAKHYGQPIDPSVWLNDPLVSSYPPSIAVHAVRKLVPETEEAFLRRMRQAVFLEARNITKLSVMVECAADVGLDAERMRQAFQAGEGKAGFMQDLAEVRRLPVRGFPTLIFTNPAGEGLVLRGTQRYDRLEEALLKVSGLERVEGRPGVLEALMAYGTGTTREFSELLGLDLADTAQALTEAGAAKRPLAGDALWSSL